MHSSVFRRYLTGVRSSQAPSSQLHVAGHIASYAFGGKTKRQDVESDPALTVNVPEIVELAEKRRTLNLLAPTDT